jgi:hypothetical protein
MAAEAAQQIDLLAVLGAPVFHLLAPIGLALGLAVSAVLMGLSGRRPTSPALAFAGPDHVHSHGDYHHSHAH